MPSNELRLFRAAGLISAGMFLILLLVRVDALEVVFGGPKTFSAGDAAALHGRESWMSIFQKDLKIGFAHTRLAPRSTGYELEETVHMRVATLGMVQGLRLHTRAALLSDLSVERFDFEIASGQFRFRAHGARDGGLLRVVTETAGARRTLDVPLKSKTYLTGAVIYALSSQSLKAGDRYGFDLFDPSTLGQTTVQVEVVGREEIHVMGKPHAATRILMNLKGMSQTAWIADDGELLRERGLLGMRLEKATREEALQDIGTAAGEDLAELASVAPGRELADPAGLEHLRVRIGGVQTDGLQLKGGRQSFSDGILTVRRERLEDLAETLPEPELTALERVYLRPEPLIQSDHERIRSLAESIVSDPPSQPPLDKARRLMQWVHLHIEKRPVLSMPDALSTLENRMGDCNEHAMLLAALARAAGIPARVEAGLVYLKGKFYYHAWNLLYVGRWVTADAVFGQLPADVTHLRFVTGSMQQQLNLAGVIGSLTIDILDPL
jgi:hypothetical protein